MSEKFANNASSTLNGALTDSATSLTVASASSFPGTGQFRVKVDNEILLVTSVSSNTFTVVRGQEGTTASSHDSGATVTHVLTAGALTQFQSDTLAQMSGWVTALDLDFTTLAPMTLSLDTTYLLGGYLWTKINTANESPNTTISAADGLKITPTNNSTDYSPGGQKRNVPGIYIPLSSVIPNLDPTMGIRVWVYNSSISPATANLQMADVVLDTGVMSKPNICMKRGHYLGQTLSALCCNGATEYTALTSVTLDSTNNVMVIELQRMTDPQVYFYAGGYSNGWPANQTLIPLKNPMVAGWDSSAVTPANLVLLLAAQAGSSAAPTVKYGRVRVEYRPASMLVGNGTGSTLSTPQITSDQNNYSPSNFSNAGIVRLSSDASRIITGLDATAAITLKTLVNIGSNNIHLANDSTNSTSANRIYTPDGVDLLLASGKSAQLVYDVASSRWRVLSSTRYTSTGTRVPPDGNDIAVFAFDESSASTTTFVNTGTESGNLTSNGASLVYPAVDGKFTRAARLVGASGPLLSSSAGAWQPSTTLSISAWINVITFMPAGSIGRTVYKAAVATWTSPWECCELCTFNNANGSGFMNLLTTAGSKAISFTGFPLNKWQHVGMTYDGAILRWYWNGQLYGTSTNTTPADIDWQASRPWYLGKVFSTSSESADFLVSDLRFANVTRDASYFANIYAKGVSANLATTSVRTVTSSGAVYPEDNTICIGTLTGATTLTLPANPVVGEQHVIKDAAGSLGAYPLTLSGNGQNIDGASILTLSSQYVSATLAYTGSQWSVTSTATKLPNHFISPAAQGQVWGATKSGNFTAGMGYRFLSTPTIIGVKFYLAWAGGTSKSVKVKVVDVSTSPSTLLASKTATVYSGLNTVLLDSPITPSDLTHVYVAAIYETSGTLYPGWTANGAIWSPGYPTLVGPNVLCINAFFAEGDATPPLAPTGSDVEAVEFVFTV